MNREILDLPPEAVTEFLALAFAALQGNHHVPQHHGAGVEVPLAFLRVKFAGAQLIEWEAQHVRCPVYLPELPVDGVDALVVG